MAIEYDISSLLGKTENEGSTDAGRLTAAEWNKLVSAVGEVQTKVEGTMKGIKYNGGAEEGGQTFSEIDSDGYLKMTVADNSGYDMNPFFSQKPPSFITRGSECLVGVYVSSKQMNNSTGEFEPATAPSTVNIYINDVLVNTGRIYDQSYGDTSSIWYDPTKLTMYTYDLSTAKAASLSVGVPNFINIEINNGRGTIKYLEAEVNVIELSLKVNSFGDSNVFTESQKPYISAIVSGNDANLNAKVDGEQIITNLPVKNGETNNLATSYFDSVNTHGVHTLEIWASVTKSMGGTDYEISTQVQKFTYIYGTSLAQPVVMSNFSNKTPEEYSTLNVSYIAYKYNNTSVAVKDTVSVAICNHLGYDEDGNPIPGTVLGEPATSEVTFDVTTNSGSGTAGISLFPVTVNGESVSLVGKKLIKISIGDFSQYTEIEVRESTVKLQQLGGYAVYLTSAGRNNNQPDKNEWISKDGKDLNGNKLVVNTTFNDDIEFLNTGSGWIADSDGNVAMHLRKGKYFTLNYQPFSVNPVFDDGTNNGNKRGKTISFELATRNCLKSDSTVISCMDDSNGNERGFLITASSAILKSNNFGMQAKFRENTRIKIDFVIEGIQNEYKYTTIAGKDATEDDWEKDKISKEALCIIYVDGVYQTLKVIPNGTTFLHGRTGIPPKSIVFGSEDCDLDIYNIRIYDQALTPAQIVSNYAYDTPKYEDKIAIAQRNDIFDNTSLGNKPNINIEKLRRARPELPFFYVKMDTDLYEEIMPYDKSNWKNMKVTEWKNPMNPDQKTGGAVSFTTDAGQLRNQGTSSMTYPWPWRNWDWKLNKKQGSGKFTLGDGTQASKWCQYLGMSNTEDIAKITLKKDYASSEMCNNAITSEYFTDMAVGIGGNPGFEEVLSLAQRPLGANTPFRLTFKAIPCFMFQELADSTQEGTAGKGYEAMGMMNLIPNKNECGHLGFMGDYVWDPNKDITKRSQSWELADNMDDWFWYKKIEPIHVETGVDANNNPISSIINDCLECYEARYPKDSTLNKDDEGKYQWNNEKDEADFGGTPKGYTTLTSEQKLELDDEQSDIIEFHNWLVDCNRQIPEDYKEEHGDYRDLTGDESAAAWNNGKYTKDTPDYRLAKFIAEAPTRLIIDQFCLYYIWRETFHAFDSGFKNLQVYTMGKANDEVSYMQWGCMVRDADTTLGIENTGKDIFPPHLEDIDYYTADDDAEGNAVSNVRFVYGGANNMYHAKSIDKLGGHPILNGQLGTLWINLRDGFRSRIGEIYRELKANSARTNWNATNAIKRFRNHQEKWCENLYNFGMRQYFGGAPFVKWIESGLGDKKNSRASWLERGFYYRDSKYMCLSDVATVRAVTYETPDLPAGNTANEPLKMKAYIPMYFLTGATTQEPTTCTSITRVTDTDNTFDVIPGPGGMGLASTGDQNRWFWGCSQLTEIGNLARVCKFKVIQQLDLPKVRELSFGHEPSRDGVTYKEYYYVTEDGVSKKRERTLQNEFLESFSVEQMKQLIILDVTNHNKLSAIEGLASCTQLQEFYAKGTDVLRTIDLPATTSLRKLYLGKSLTRLDLNNLTGIEDFELEGSEHITNVYIQNCGSYMAERTYDIALQVLPSLESVYDENNRNICTFTGVNWQNAEASYIERLLNINAQLSGKIKLRSLSNDLKVRLVAAYGNIDDVNNQLHITYNQQEIQTAKLPSKVYVHEEGKYQLKFTVNPLSANTYSSAVWSISSNPYASFANEYDAANGVLTRNGETANRNTSAKLTVTIKQLPYTNGDPRADIVLESTVFFYERLAKPGDYVFQDGTYSDELDESKTVIGVCFYVDPKNAENRLMMALDSVQVSSYSMPWGLGTGGNNVNGTTITGYYGSPQAIMLSYDETYSCYNLKNLTDLTVAGVTQTSGANYFSDSYFRDINATDNSYFKSFKDGGDIGWAASYFGDLGWKRAENRIYIDNLIDANNNSTSIVVNVGDVLPTGLYNTLAIIEHRNKILDNYSNDADMEFIRPYKDEYSSELESLRTLSNKADGLEISNRLPSVDNTYGSHLYYPAASVAFAYSPNASGLLDKFKIHNWFLPSSGELLRMCYYAYQSYKDGVAQETPVNSMYDESYDEPANAFYNAIKEGKLKMNNFYSGNAESGTTMWSSTETTGEKYAISISSNNGSWQQLSKSSSGSVRPICRF